MMFLHRVSIRPRHLDDWLATWPQQLHDLQRHGFTHHQAYLQEHAEPKLTWLYSHPDASPAFPAPVAEATPVTDAPPTTSPPADDTPASVQTHVVQPGEFLKQLAVRYYGDEELWTLIYEANAAGIGPDPDLLPAGIELVIPSAP